MALYAHSVIEVPNDPEDTSKGVTTYERGDTVPADLPGIDELRKYGSVSDEKYDPEVDKSPPPAVIEIDGVRYVQEPNDA